MEITPPTLVIFAALISGGSALFGVAITSYFNMRTVRISKESEERKHHKEIVVKAAIENWKQVTELAFKSGQQQFILSGLDPFLVHMNALADVIFDPATNADNIKERLETVHRIAQISEQTMRKF